MTKPAVNIEEIFRLFLKHLIHNQRLTGHKLLNERKRARRKAKRKSTAQDKKKPGVTSLLPSSRPSAAPFVNFSAPISIPAAAPAQIIYPRAVAISDKPANDSATDGFIEKIAGLLQGDTLHVDGKEFMMVEGDEQRKKDDKVEEAIKLELATLKSRLYGTRHIRSKLADFIKSPDFKNEYSDAPTNLATTSASHLLQYLYTKHPELEVSLLDYVRSVLVTDASKVMDIIKQTFAFSEIPPINPREGFEDTVAQIEDKQEGSGISRKVPDALSNFDIDRLMEQYRTHGFTGVFALNEFHKIHPINPADFSFIANTLSMKNPAVGHWVAIKIHSGAAEDDQVVEFYDPFGLPPEHAMLLALKRLLRRIGQPKSEFKVSRVQDQNIHSKNCGWFAMRFLRNRYLGHPFRTASGFDAVVGENNVKKMKKHYAKFGKI